MRYRIWAVIGVVLLAVALSSCITPRAAAALSQRRFLLRRYGRPLPTRRRNRR